ncbi:MAG: metalloregulator ArsR/SmtB family transcription factor [Betaproteobacteria bacterium]|jgi:ArsR family transcriptional regulator|nr:metalloregulator ArsR/SmtB family transcription factor [Betaproteobacteria bacterium]
MHVTAVELPEIFQALGDSTRLRVVRLLAASGEACCLCELVDSLHEPQYKLSRHLKILKRSGLLGTEKDGRWIYHRLVADPTYLASLYDAVMRLPDPRHEFASDLARLRGRMRLRDNGRCRVGIQTAEFAVLVA